MISANGTFTELMNGLIVIELRIDATALTPQERVLLGLLLELPPLKLVRCLRILLHWQQASPAQKAMALKLLNQRLTNKQVAELCQVTDRHLRRNPHFKEFARSLRQQQQRQPLRGFKNSDGKLEAWHDEDASDDGGDD
jgi:hypothetical protein